MGSIGATKSGKDWLQMVRTILFFYIEYKLVLYLCMSSLTSLLSSDADSPPKKRNRKATAHFKPPADVKMNAERQPPSLNSKRKRAKAKAESEPTIQMLLDQLNGLPIKLVGAQIVPSLQKRITKTKEGRSVFAQAISQKEIVNLPAGGNSKAALNKSKKTAADLIIGLATILDPENPDRLKSLLSATQEKAPSSLSAAPMHPSILPAPPMHPSNPHTSNLQAVLPERRRDHEDEATRFGIPVPTTNPTIESLAALMAEDDRSFSSESSSSDSNSDSSRSSNSSSRARREVRKTAHLNTKADLNRRLNRKSMTYKSVKKETKAVEAVRTSLGTAMIEHIRTKCKTVKERRPILAVIALNDHKRKDVNNAIRCYINKFEWRKIKIHAKYPGPLKPVKKPLIRRLKIAKELLYKLLAFLNSPGNLQRSAFGSQLKEMLDGSETVVMDRVDRMKNLNKLTSDYITSVFQELDVISTKDGESVPEPECRCKKVDQKTFRRCLKPHQHDGTCSFTPAGSVCPSTVQALIESLTAGDIKSLSGLDDIKVLKGRDNFKALREIVNIVCSHDEAAALLKDIDDTELYHQTDFVPHLEKSGTHKCNCMTCGFNCKGD
jgi:hypothetical protein